MTNAELFRALADETRLCIVKKLTEGEKSACQIIPCSKKSQPTVSSHLKVLANAGVIDFKKSGKERIYFIKDERVKKILGLLGD
ncbi:MAG: metalloregulator ArsR/SmtB family transcription factor [Candidatus Micrarchaeia archaeon]|jgi:DNA-binding transcriptional ArsR family regulator